MRRLQEIGPTHRELLDLQQQSGIGKRICLDEIMTG